MAFDVYACLVRQAGVPGSQESGENPKRNSALNAQLEEAGARLALARRG
jgi:hypothetical protein